MTKKEIAAKAARNREIQSRMSAIYLQMEKEKREEYTAEEKREMAELKQELEENHREIMLSKDEAAIAELRENIDRNKQYREYLQGVRQKREDNTITLAPKSPNDGSSITESGAINLYIEDIIDTKENGLGRPVGQSFITGVEGDELYPYSINDVEIEEVGEIDAVNDQALEFTNVKVVSNRVSLSVGISNKAIDNAAFDLVAFVLYKIQKAWRIYFAKKNYSHANWNKNKGAFSLVTPGEMTLDNTIGAQIDEAFADIAELGFDDEGAVQMLAALRGGTPHYRERLAVRTPIRQHQAHQLHAQLRWQVCEGRRRVHRYRSLPVPAYPAAWTRPSNGRCNKCCRGQGQQDRHRLLDRDFYYRAFQQGERKRQRPASGICSVQGRRIRAYNRLNSLKQVHSS